jgi:hypothetical protein
MSIRKTFADFHNASTLIDAMRWAKGAGREVAEGIPYWSELAGPMGVNVTLLAEPGTPLELIEAAAREIVQSRDVVNLAVMDYSEAPDAHSLTFQFDQGAECVVEANTAGVCWLIGGGHWMNFGERPRLLQTDWEGVAIECPAGAVASASYNAGEASLVGIEGVAKGEERLFSLVIEVAGRQLKSAPVHFEQILQMARAPRIEAEYHLDMLPAASM